MHRTLAGWLGMLSLVVTGLALAQGSAPPQTQATVAKGRAVMQRMEGLTPETVKAMSPAEVLELYTTYQDVSLAVVHVAYREVAQAQGQDMSEAGFKRFLAAQGIEKLLTEETQQKFELLGRRLTEEQKNAVNLDLQKRYPAYDSYIKRAMVASAFARLSAARSQVSDAYGQTQAIPAKQDPALLDMVRKERGVRSATYENGRFTVVFDALIQEGGVLEVAASAKPAAGGIEWKCSGTKIAQNLLPSACRQ